MNIRDALGEGALKLKNEETPFLDASVLLAHTLKISREKLLASYPDLLSHEHQKIFQELIQKRAGGIPVAYLTGRKEFFGRDFYVDSRVLVPRPDTEILVEAALKIADILGENPEFSAPDSLRVLDVCTGTGCVPLTLVLENPLLYVAASDISRDALDVFEINRKKLGNPPAALFQSDLLRNVPGKWHIITSNPPYLTRSEVEEMKQRSWPEPFLALLGGENGLDLVFRLIKESKDSLIKNGYLLLEAASPQMTDIREYMEAEGFREICVLPDLAGRDRVIQGNFSGT